MAEIPGVQKRFSEKSDSKRVRFKGHNHSMHMKDGVQGSAEKGGKVKYQDLGHKSEFSKEKSYPSLHVSGDKLDLSDHKPGDDVAMHVKGKLKEHRIDNDGKHHFHVEVTHGAKKD